MSKAEVNNQIILMRKDVVQARVHTIKKLTRDAFKLRTKKGSEPQKAKNLRKADRIVAEIFAVKKIKKDEIIHFALTHSSTLEEILEKQSDPSIRIKAKIANHKKFSQKIAQFKEKYPHFLKLIEPGRKKKAILEFKAKKKEQKLKKKAANTLVNTEDGENEEANEKSSNESDDGDDNEDENGHESDDADDNGDKSDDGDANEDDNGSESDEDDTISNESKDLKPQTLTNNSVSSKKKKIKPVDLNTSKVGKESGKKVAKPEKKLAEKAVSVKSMKKKETKKLSSDDQKEEVESEVKLDSKKSKKKKTKTVDAIKAVSKLATVKKFTEILEEDDNCSENQKSKVDSSNVDINVEKEVDPFFVTDSGTFFSVAPRKRKLDSEENEKLQKNQNAPNKFPRFKDNDSRLASDKPHPKWKNQQNGGARFENNKSGPKWKNQESNVSRFNSDKSNYNRRNENHNGDKFHGKERKGGFNKFKDEGEQKSLPRRERRAQQFENEDAKNLHPSWEAKKKQQDALKLGFQGKKIVFGDD